MSISFQNFVDLYKGSSSGLIAAIILSLFAIWIARRLGLMDIPGSSVHKLHTRPTPLAGGIALISSSVFLIIVFHLWKMPFSALMASVLIIFIFGIWDDARGLSALQKLVGQVLASVLVLASGASVKFLENISISFLNTNTITVLNWILTIVWLVGITNSMNLIDSMDGLVVGIAGIAFAFFMIMAMAAQQTNLALFSSIFLGICIGLYVFNITPAKLFLGDSGSQSLGFVLAAVALIYAPNNLPQGSSWFVPIMILGIPIFDTTLVVISRIRHHKPIFQADHSHTYHRLVAIGLDSNRAVLVIQVTALIINFLAFIALSLSPLKASIIFGIVIIVGVVILIFFEKKSTKVIN